MSLKSIAPVKETESQVRRFRILWLIPVLALGYIGWVNLMPLGVTISHFINIGGEDTAGKAVITGPFDRVSGRKETDGISFRELQKKLVYFELEDRKLNFADEITVRVRFRDSFPNDAIFMLGARNTAEWGYYWKEGYAPFYKELTNLSPVSAKENLYLYTMKPEAKAVFQDLDDFLQNPPFGSIIATNDKSLNINQVVRPREILADQFATRDILPTPMAGGTDEFGYFETDTVLRAPQDFCFYSRGGTLELTVAKRDLNRYDGEDSLDIRVSSFDGSPKARVNIPDDGDSIKSGNLGQLQYQTVRAENLERGAYRLSLKSAGGGSDCLITHLALNQTKLVMPKNVFLAGNLYLGEEPQPVSVWCHLFREGEITLSTAHNSAFQNVHISAEDYNETIKMNTVNTKFSTTILKAGTYKITSEKGDITIEAPNGYFAFTEDSIFTPMSGFNREENGTLLINTSLRGEHTLWTEVNNSSLELKVTKQDLNRYDNPDELAIEVYSLSHEFKGKITIPDDGDEGSTNIMGPLQQEFLKMDDLEPGAYRIELKGGSDLLIRAMAINQKQLVTDGSVYLTGMNTAYFKDGLTFDPVRLYTQNFTTGQIKFHTFHNSGLQQVVIQGNDFSNDVDINKVDTDFITSLEAGSYQLTFPTQDVLIEHEGYFSFTPDSFFIPQRCQVIDLKYDLSWLKENVDYILVNSRDYMPPEEDDGWLIMRTTWKSEDLFITNNKLSFCFDVPHLTQPGDSEKTIPIDWIEINLRIPPLYEK